jgi:hypothetical protein
MTYKALHSKLKVEHRELHKQTEVNTGAIPASVATQFMIQQ